VPLLVADCKYKRVEPDGFKQHDVYQMLAYCTALGLDRGLLVYPKHAVPVDDEIAVVNSPVRIRQRSLDLSGSLPELKAACRALADEILTGASPTDPRIAKTAALPVPVPGIALRLAVGDFAEEGILIGQRLAPAVLQRSGFAFAHDDVDTALRASL